MSFPIGEEFEYAQDFDSLTECMKRAEGWVARGYGVIIIPRDDKIRLYITRRRICYKKRIGPVYGMLIW